MLELRYHMGTKHVTGWCGDEKQFGNLRLRQGERIVVIDIPVPPFDSKAYLFDKPTQSLVSNPEYSPRPDWQALWQAATTQEEKLSVLARRLGLE